MDQNYQDILEDSRNDGIGMHHRDYLLQKKECGFPILQAVGFLRL